MEWTQRCSCSCSNCGNEINFHDVRLGRFHFGSNSTSNQNPFSISSMYCFWKVFLQNAIYIDQIYCLSNGQKFSAYKEKQQQQQPNFIISSPFSCSFAPCSLIPLRPHASSMVPAHLLLWLRFIYLLACLFIWLVVCSPRKLENK